MATLQLSLFLSIFQGKHTLHSHLYPCIPVTGSSWRTPKCPLPSKDHYKQPSGRRTVERINLLCTRFTALVSKTKLTNKQNKIPLVFSGSSLENQGIQVLKRQKIEFQILSAAGKEKGFMKTISGPKLLEIWP